MLISNEMMYINKPGNANMMHLVSIFQRLKCNITLILFATCNLRLQFPGDIFIASFFLLFISSFVAYFILILLYAKVSVAFSRVEWNGKRIIIRISLWKIILSERNRKKKKNWCENFRCRMRSVLCAPHSILRMLGLLLNTIYQFASI